MILWLVNIDFAGGGSPITTLKRLGRLGLSGGLGAPPYLLDPDE